MSNSQPRTTSQGEPLISAYLHNRAKNAGVPLAGNFELTARCNFNCKMCYVHQLHCPVEKELSAQQWIAIGKAARERGMLFLLLTGGEPFLRPDFAEIYTELRKMGLLISINTNASLLTDELMEVFKKYPPVRFNISLYGGCNETYRSLCGNAAYDLVTKNILRLKDAGFDVKINCSVTPYNVSDVPAIYAFGKEHNLPVQAVTYMYPPVRINDCNYGDAPARFTAEDAAKYQLFCREQYLTPEQLATTATALPEGEAECVGELGEPIRCRAGRTAFWMTWDGRMLPCGMFPNDGHSVVEKGFDAAWMGTRVDTAGLRLPPECTNCEKKNRCVACAAACLAETGSTQIKPEYICRMTHHLEHLTVTKYCEVAHETES